MGVMARKNMRASNDFDGQNIALAAIIVGAVNTVIYVFVLGPFLLGKNQALVDWLGAAIITCVPFYFVLQYGSAMRGPAAGASRRSFH